MVSLLFHALLLFSYRFMNGRRNPDQRVAFAKAFMINCFKKNCNCLGRQEDTKDG